MTMGSAGRNTVIAFLMIAGLLQSANAATLPVGGSIGWTLGISPTFYDEWAKQQSFAVGDTLDFAYSGTLHNVFEVTAADLASCNIASPLKTYDTSGGASVPITTAGDHYYICGIPGHCLANMQMSIVVSAAAAPPASAPAPSKAAPAPSKKAPAHSKTPAPSPVPVSPLASAPASAPAPAPGPAHEKSKGHQSAWPATIVGVVLCVVTSFLFL